MDNPTKVLAVEKRDDQVAVVSMNVPSAQLNVLRLEHAEEFHEVLSLLRSDGSVKAIVVTSGKQDGFIAGADVEILESTSTAEEGTRIAKQGQESNDLVESLRKPVVAAIHGVCLGGGLELALACHGRVASDDPSTRFGLPEVQLGLLPGAGGTQRLPQLIGIRESLDLLLTGKKIGAGKAKAIGLVDELVPRAILLEVAARLALDLSAKASSKGDPVSKLVSWLSPSELQEHALADNPLGRKVVFDQARDTVLSKTGGHYPAPKRILEVVREGLASGFERGLKLERTAFGELAVSSEGKALMGLFLSAQALKREQRAEVKDAASERPQIGVVGAGLMGSGIAYVSAAVADCSVRLKDRDREGVLRGLAHVRAGVDRRVARRKLSKVEGDRLMTRVTGTASYLGFDQVDIVVEAVFEDLELKHQVIRELEEVLPESAIIGSNTSSLPIREIANGAKRPERVLGLHYFSPVERMPLLEVVAREGLAPGVLETAVRLGHAQGKTVVVVKDGPGFFTTRVLAPFLAEASRLVLEGNPIELVDQALTNFGFPVGPLKLSDEVGLDVAQHVATTMNEAFGERMAAPRMVTEMLKNDRLGRKNQRGFYRYDQEGSESSVVDARVYEEIGIETKKTDDLEGMAERCTLLFVNEAIRCFGERVIDKPRDGDVAAVMGLGFPPFLGGPFRYADRLGVSTLLQKLEALEQRYGCRFEPAPPVKEFAAAGKRFLS